LFNRGKRMFRLFIIYPFTVQNTHLRHESAYHCLLSFVRVFVQSVIRRWSSLTAICRSPSTAYRNGDNMAIAGAGVVICDGISFQTITTSVPFSPSCEYKIATSNYQKKRVKRLKSLYLNCSTLCQ